MSYCVNCGVELDKTCMACPLCNTPVYNPNQPVDVVSPKPYPDKKGTIETPDSKEFTILMSIVLGTIAIVCGLLNHVVFTNTRWSFYVIGLCAIIWISAITRISSSMRRIYDMLGRLGHIYFSMTRLRLFLTVR